MQDDQQKQTDSPRPGATGPGERLQAERIRKGLSVGDVASRMHLHASILEAIEENNFEEITAPIFVKGYLRAYARIVGLDEDEMIQQYQDLYSEEDPPISTTSNMAPELSSDDTRIKWTTYLVILLLAVLLGAWWWNKQQSLEPPVSLDVQSPTLSGVDAADTAANGSETKPDTVLAEIVVDEPADEATEDDVVDSEVVASSEVSISASTETSAPVEADASVGVESESAVSDEIVETQPTESAADSTDVAVAIPVDAPVPEVDDPIKDEQNSSQAAVQDVAAETEVAESGTRERPGRAAPVGDDRLRIVVHADTWADVKDSNNFQLEYNLLRAGTTFEFTGQAPFSVFLGNGHGVEVQFNGEEIGFSARIRDDNTARLNIGG